MLLSVCILILTLICKTLANYERGYTSNVGTVLFTANDRNKDRWSKTEIALLQARKHFQTILPPPGFTKNFNEEYIHGLLRYFRYAYSNIKRDTSDVETNTILATALSDTLGGYLKVWVLPLAKFDFYGGTVSQENVVNLFKFYNEIKDYLGTEGDGWRSPDDLMLNSITINVATRSTNANTRSIKDPCNHFAFFEKTPNGLNIPLPSVNWDKRLSTMFIPLKNLSLIPINFPDKDNTLRRYYETAKNCIAESNPREAEIFENKFQRWLDSDIIPHLKDDNLYLGLDGILTLVNNTRNYFSNIIHQCNSNKCHPSSTTYMSFEITPRKLMILFLILLLEVAWCIPAVTYLLCSKKKKDRSSNMFLFIDPNKGKNNKINFFRKENHKNFQVDTDYPTVRDLKDIETQRSSTILQLADADTSCTGHSPFQQSVVTYNEYEAQCPSSHYTVAVGTGSRSYISSKTQSSEAIMTDIYPALKKPSLKKTPDSISRNIQKHTARVLPLSSQEKLRRSEQTDKNIPIIEDAESSPKIKRTSKDTDKKSLLPQKRFELSKVSKVISPTKRLESSKDTKNVIQKRTEQIRGLKILPIKNKDNEVSGPPPSVKVMSKIETQKKPKVEYGHIKTSKSPTIGKYISKPTECNKIETKDPSCHQNMTPISCPCTGCLKTLANVKHEIKTNLINSIAPLPNDKPVISDLIGDDGQVAKKSTRFQIFKEHKCKKAAFKISDSGKPLFEITIDRPGTEIFVDLSNAHKMHHKRSKIPKPRTKIPELVMLPSGNVQRTSSPNRLEKPNTVNTQVKKKSNDDIDVARDSGRSDKCCYNKLNDTI